ncbi:sensor domain-containing diguanylate cyclase [Desulfohalovibrio reitneri]|uniref:sensor domain-containing diguanylate cyclase n=1 Tax=Desulfohalovibrio reitneri TaxID=1307759 RepID=UPI0004A7589A|nr:diguanylate cyclase [Desulfohalovibrio reitneri]
MQTELFTSLNDCLQKAFPPVTTRLIQEAVKDKPDFAALAEVIRMDPVLAAAVLGLVNSPFYSLSQRCTDLQRAAVVLGSKEILKLALSVSFHKNLSDVARTRDKDSYATWRVIVWSAIAAELLAERLAPGQADQAYLCALFKDLSLLLMDCAAPDLFPGSGGNVLVCLRPNQLDEERELLGVEHPELTNQILSKLGMAPESCPAIPHHHDYENLDRHDPMTQAVILATCWSEAELSSAADPFPVLRVDQLLKAHVGLDEAEMAELRGRCVERFREMLKTLGIKESAPDKRFYQHSLQEMQRAYFLGMDILTASGGLGRVAGTIRLHIGPREMELALRDPDGGCWRLFSYADGDRRALQTGRAEGRRDLPWSIRGRGRALTASGEAIGELRLPRSAALSHNDNASLELYLRFASQFFEQYSRQQAVLESRAGVYESLPVGVARMDRSGRLLDHNERLAEYLGPRTEHGGLPESLTEVPGIFQDPEWRAFLQNDRPRISSFFCESSRDAEQPPCLYLSAHKRDEDILFMLEDVTEVSELEMQAMKQLGFMETLVSSMRDLVFTLDDEGTVTFASPSVSPELTGKNLFSISKPTGPYSGKWDPTFLHEPHTNTVEAVVMVSRDRCLRLELVFSPLSGDLSDGKSHLVVGRDMTAIRRLEEKLKKQAMYDGLTGLLNHTQFQSVLDREVQRSRRTGRALGLIFLDLDDFKKINDTEGHQAGDRVLKKVGEVLLQNVRRGMDFPSRYGGDEFAVVYTEITPRQTAMLAQRLEDAVRRAFDGKLGLSAGVALLKEGEDSTSLVKRADEAAYTSKSKGGRTITMAD